MTKKLLFIMLVLSVVSLSYAQEKKTDSNAPVSKTSQLPGVTGQAGASDQQSPQASGTGKNQPAQVAEKAGITMSEGKGSEKKSTLPVAKKPRRGSSREQSPEKTQAAQADTSPCNRPGFVPDPTFQSRVIWATYLVLTNGRALPIQRYIVNQCNIIAVFPDGSGRMYTPSQVDLTRTAQFVTTEEEARRLRGTMVVGKAPGEGNVLGVGYYDFGRQSTPAAQGSSSAQPQTSPPAQVGTPPAQAQGALAPTGATSYGAGTTYGTGPVPGVPAPGGMPR